jgi:hypothetical protein
MPDLLARFKDHTVSIWQKHGIIPLDSGRSAIKSEAEGEFAVSGNRCRSPF